MGYKPQEKGLCNLQGIYYVVSLLLGAEPYSDKWLVVGFIGK